MAKKKAVKKSVVKKKTAAAKQPALNLNRLSATKLASILGLHSTVPLKSYKDRGCPRNEDGTFSLKAYYHWRVKQLSTEVREASAEADTELAEQRRVKTEILKYDLESRRGGTITIDAARRIFSAFIGTGRSIFQDLGNRAAMVVPEKYRPIVRDEVTTGVEDGLRSMARAGDELNEQRRKAGMA